MEEADDLRGKVIDLINGAVTLTLEEVSSLVSHLFSPAVMLRKFEDLKDVDAKMLEGVIGSLPAKKLIQAFQMAEKNNGMSREESQNTQENPRTHQPEELRRVPFKDGEFSFNVNWNDLPKKTLKNMDRKNKAEKEGDTADVLALKNALAIKILARYAAFREAHSSVTQLSPGQKLCYDVAQQVALKYRYAIRDVINGVVHGSGVDSFCKLLLNKTQNDTRPLPNSTATNISRGKGVPGVKPDEYMPSISKAEKLSQKKIQKELQEMEALVDKENRDWDSIVHLMNESYELQRELIVEATKLVINNGNSSEEEEDEGSNGEKMIEKIMDNWPFLFTLKPLHNHHKRLTGRNLEERFNAYMADPNNLRFLFLFLTSCSSANLKNVILKENVNLDNLTSGTKLLLAICMIANHFKEDYTTLLWTVERTTALDELLAAEPRLPSSICIVALGNDLFAAENYYIALDQVGVLETTNAGNAILMQMELCFVLNIEYPPGLAHTFEFIERVILEMTFLETKVRNKKGKTLLVLTEAVRVMSKKFVDFTQQLRENLRDFD